MNGTPIGTSALSIKSRSLYYVTIQMCLSLWNLVLKENFSFTFSLFSGQLEICTILWTVLKPTTCSSKRAFYETLKANLGNSEQTLIEAFFTY